MSSSRPPDKNQDDSFKLLCRRWAIRNVPKHPNLKIAKENTDKAITRCCLYVIGCIEKERAKFPLSAHRPRDDLLVQKRFWHYKEAKDFEPDEFDPLWIVVQIYRHSRDQMAAQKARRDIERLYEEYKEVKNKEKLWEHANYFAFRDKYFQFDREYTSKAKGVRRNETREEYVTRRLQKYTMKEFSLDFDPFSLPPVSKPTPIVSPRGRGMGGSGRRHGFGRPLYQEPTPPPTTPQPSPPPEHFDPTIYCICRQVQGGSMICCDNKRCPYEWFHFPCVGVVSDVRGKWYCPLCRNPPTMTVEEIEGGTTPAAAEKQPAAMVKRKVSLQPPELSPKKYQTTAARRQKSIEVKESRMDVNDNEVASESVDEQNSVDLSVFYPQYLLLDSDAEDAAAEENQPAANIVKTEESQPPKRKRGRPRKFPAPIPAPEADPPPIEKKKPKLKIEPRKRSASPLKASNRLRKRAVRTVSLKSPFAPGQSSRR